MNERQLAAAIRTAGEVGGNSDGIVVDKHGALYITDVTHNGIVRYRPQSGRFTLLPLTTACTGPIRRLSARMAR